MKRIASSDSFGALMSMCPPADERSPRSSKLYSRGFQSILDGFDEEGCVDDVGHVSEKKRRLSIDQVKALEKNFEVENKLEPERKVKLAQELGLQPRQVAVWFQNRRARWKTKQLERDFGILKTNFEALKLNHDALKHDNEALLEEIRELKSKLDGENRTESNVSVKEEEVFMPDSGNNYMEEIRLKQPLLISQTKAETKDGSSDSDSSAILNEENRNSSPNPAVSSSAAIQTSQLEKTVLSTPASPSLKVGGYQFQKIYQPPAYPYVKTEERDDFSGDEACNFFDDDQAPSLHWYCPDQWN